MNISDATVTPTPLSSLKESPSTSEKKPSLLWRRLAAFSVDILILHAFVWIGTAITGTSIFGMFLAWFAFFILWYDLSLKHDTTPGKALAGITTKLSDDGSEKSPRLLLRFGITWIPLLFLSLPSFEYGQEAPPLMASILQWLALLWYIALLIGVIRSRGKSGIQDAICKSEAVFTILKPLSPARKVLLWVCALGLALEMGLPIFFAENTEAPTGTATENISENTGTDLPFESLGLAAHSVSGVFKELDLLDDDVYGWTGTASVISKEEEKLYLVSNSHVLGLRELAQSDDSSDMIPEINAYVLYVTFASGKEAPVLRFGDQAGSLDLSLLEVDAAGLVEGKDYVTIPFDMALQIAIGDEAVAVGSPHGLAGTHTFGRISAVRDLNDGEPYRALQTDAAINPGNSGGPLFVKRGNIFKWAGVNTFTYGSDNLGFAIDAKHVWNSKYMWFSVSPQGAADAIKSGYSRNAVVE